MKLAPYESQSDRVHQYAREHHNYDENDYEATTTCHSFMIHRSSATTREPDMMS